MPHDDDPVSQLHRCHDRIREFARLAARLPPGETASAAELADAAADVLRYFGVALPRHEKDEEDTLAPALIAAAAPPELVDALGRMTAEHGPIDQAIADAEPLWTILAHEPERREELGPKLAAAAAHLQALLATHLPAEEERIFSAVARLPRESLETIRAEMRARRGKP